jgi:hypothetical protein
VAAFSPELITELKVAAFSPELITELKVAGVENLEEAVIHNT